MQKVKVKFTPSPKVFTILCILWYIYGLFCSTWDYNFDVKLFAHDFTGSIGHEHEFVWFARDAYYNIGLLLLAFCWSFCPKTNLTIATSRVIFWDMVYEFGDFIVTNNEYDFKGLVFQNIFIILLIIYYYKKNEPN